MYQRSWRFSQLNKKVWKEINKGFYTNSLLFIKFIFQRQQFFFLPLFFLLFTCVYSTFFFLFRVFRDIKYENFEIDWNKLHFQKSLQYSIYSTINAQIFGKTEFPFQLNPFNLTSWTVWQISVETNKKKIKFYQNEERVFFSFVPCFRLNLHRLCSRFSFENFLYVFWILSSVWCIWRLVNVSYLFWWLCVAIQ